MTAAISQSLASIIENTQGKLEQQWMDYEVASASADMVVLSAHGETFMAMLAHHKASLELWSRRLGRWVGETACGML